MCAACNGSLRSIGQLYCKTSVPVSLSDKSERMWSGEMKLTQCKCTPSCSCSSLTSHLCRLLHRVKSETDWFPGIRDLIEMKEDSSCGSSNLSSTSLSRKTYARWH